MRLPQFEYINPSKLQEACKYLNTNKENIKIIAGGTDLLTRIKQGLIKPSSLLNIKNLTELQEINYDKNKGLIIGAGVSLERLARSLLVRKYANGLSDAVCLVGARQHQVMGTLGGNLALDTRCWFYNQSSNWRRSIDSCFKLGGKRCHVAPNFTNCSASFEGDTAPILIAYDAMVKIVSSREERTLPLSNIYSGRGENPIELKKNELLVEIIIPPMQEGVFAKYLKLRPRESIDFAQAGVAVKYKLDENQRYQQVRIVINAISSKPFRVTKAENILEGNILSPDMILAVKDQVKKATRPMMNMKGPIWYRRNMILRYTEQLLLGN